MTDEVLSHLQAVMRRSGLSKRERAEWMEEMASHLDVQVGQLVESGYPQEEAITLALEKFGKPSTVRRNISRETFGMTVPTIVWLAAIWFALFLVNYGMLIMSVRAGKASVYTANLADMLRALPTSPSLMLGLCLSSLSLLKTRCRADRAGLVITLAIFGALWVLLRMPLDHEGNQLLFAFREMSMKQPWVSWNLGFLTVWGLALFAWTRNAWIGVFPTILSLAVGALNPLLWEFVIGSLHDGAPSFLYFLLISLCVRTIPIVFLLIVFKVWREHFVANRSSLTS